MPKYSTGEFGDFRIPQGLGKKIAVIGVVIACLIVVAGSAVRGKSRHRTVSLDRSMSYGLFCPGTI